MAELEAWYLTGTKQLIGGIHRVENCRGEWCVIHKPMPGPWELWRTHWRPADSMDEMFGMYRGFERICPHGVGHPAAEEYQWKGAYDTIHGCDGCPCQPWPRRDDDA